MPKLENKEWSVYHPPYLPICTLDIVLCAETHDDHKILYYFWTLLGSDPQIQALPSSDCTESTPFH